MQQPPLPNSVPKYTINAPTIPQRQPLHQINRVSLKPIRYIINIFPSNHGRHNYHHHHSIVFLILRRQQSLDGAAFSGLANIIKLLPTGTVLLFLFLNPLLTDNGQCSDSNKSVAAAVIALCGISCFVFSFTDSYRGSDGQTHYGFATLKGIWPSPAAESVDLSAYNIWSGDFVHAFFSVMVFAAVSLLDSNTVECFYPSFESTQKAVVTALPPVIGAVASTVSAVFPNKRHGIGYASSSQQESNRSSLAVGPNQNESTLVNNQSSV